MYFLNLGGGFTIQSSASKYQIAMLHCTLGGAKIGRCSKVLFLGWTLCWVVNLQLNTTKEVIWCLEASAAKILQFNINFWQETLILAKRFCLQWVLDARKNEPILQFVSFHVTKKTIVPFHRVKESIPQTKRNYNFAFPQKSNKFSLTNHIFIASFMTKFHKTSDNENFSSSNFECFKSNKTGFGLQKSDAFVQCCYRILIVHSISVEEWELFGHEIWSRRLILESTWIRNVSSFWNVSSFNLLMRRTFLLSIKSQDSVAAQEILEFWILWTVQASFYNDARNKERWKFNCLPIAHCLFVWFLGLSSDQHTYGTPH